MAKTDTRGAENGGASMRAEHEDGAMNVARMDETYGAATTGLSSEISEKRRMPKRRKDRIANAVIYFVLAVTGLIWVLPLIGMLIESFYCEAAESAVGMLQSHWGFDNYARLFGETLFFKWFGNTLLIGVVTAILQTAVQLAVGYTFSRFRFKGRKFLMSLIAVIGMFPASMTLIVVNDWLRSWNLTGANAPYGAMIVYAASSGMGYGIAKGFFDSVDRSVSEAALVDGASQFCIFYKIFLPTAKPIVIYTLMMGFMLPWSDLSAVDAILPGYTIADGLQWILDGSAQDSFATFCAGGVVVSAPIMVLFFLLQKYYLAGETIRFVGKPLRREQ